MGKKHTPKKSVKLSPVRAVLQKDGSPIDLSIVEEKFRFVKDVVQAMVEWGRNSNKQNPYYFKAIAKGYNPSMGDDLPLSNNETGRVLGYYYQGFLPSDMLVRSRVERLIRHNHVSDDKAWGAKWQAYHGDIKISKGYENSLDMTPPTPAPTLNFGAVDNQYARVERLGSTLIFHTVAYDVRVILYYRLPSRCRSAISVSLPTLAFQEDGSVVYIFALDYPRYYPPISSKFVMGLDKGKRYPYILALVDVATRLPIMFFAPSRRVKSLANSIEANETQIKNIYDIIDKLIVGEKNCYTYVKMGRYYEEIRRKRQANVRKKKQLAILCGQEIVSIAQQCGNPVIAVEDLSWIVNNMQSGRWNHAELTKWVKHYANHAGLLCYEVWSANSSQNCHKCSEQVTHNTEKRTITCADCNITMDRDENAAANMGIRVIESALKSAQTRKQTRKRKNITHDDTGKTPQHRNTNKTTRCRDKVGVTPKQVKNKVDKNRLRRPRKPQVVVFKSNLFLGTHSVKRTMGRVIVPWTVTSCSLLELRNVIQHC